MTFLIGVDEAGRGPLAGPVAVGVVAAPEGFEVAKEFPGVRDSKQLSEKKREEIFEMLTARAALGGARFVVAFGTASAIDARGIAVVVREAVARAVRSLAPLPNPPRFNLGISDIVVLLDGALTAPPEYRQKTIIGGDASVPLISLASIVAKVSRDRLMKKYATRYPAYGFERHKGYGTKAHYAALAAHGACAIHRLSYLRTAKLPEVARIKRP